MGYKGSQLASHKIGVEIYKLMRFICGERRRPLVGNILKVGDRARQSSRGKVALSVEHTDSVDDIEGVKVPEASIADDSAPPKACEEMHDAMDILRN